MLKTWAKNDTHTHKISLDAIFVWLHWASYSETLRGCGSVLRGNLTYALSVPFMLHLNSPSQTLPPAEEVEKRRLFSLYLWLTHTKQGFWCLSIYIYSTWFLKDQKIFKRRERKKWNFWAQKVSFLFPCDVKASTSPIFWGARAGASCHCEVIELTS